MKGWLKAFLKCTETRDELSTSLSVNKSYEDALSAPDATSLHHCLKNKQLKLVWFQR